MNKIKFIAKAFVIGLISLTIHPQLASANDASEYALEVLEQRFEMLDGHFDYRLTPEIEEHVKAYTAKYRKSTEILLGRTNVYFPLFEKAIEEKGLPQELKFLTIIESNLKPYARSVVGAAGLWQFMKPTGRMMGLKINRVVDERNDPIKSTHAALNYLSYLHDMFGDWTLAIAAYNCGPGNVRKAIRRGNSNDYWTIRKYLPRETRAYVPKFMAASYLMNYYLEHGLTPSGEKLEENPTTARIYKKTDFKSLAKMVDMDVKSIWRLNPMYIRGYIPASDKGYFLTLPEDKLYQFALEAQTEFDIVYQPIDKEEEITEVEDAPEVEVSREMVYIPLIEGITQGSISPSNQSEEEQKIWELYYSYELRETDVYNEDEDMSELGRYDYKYHLEQKGSFKDIQNYFYRL
ncbi:MAG: lytic transglycosylase domain-containing protein [Saprospiraceae bacterium]|nr:lytic transglycosylase domain-containing protein [Saprospiraceae bacterium]